MQRPEMEARSDALEQIVAIVGRVQPTDARFISVATVVGAALRRVLSAEKTAQQAAISLAQQIQMNQLRQETSNMIETLGRVLPQRVSLKKVEAKKEPSWWFALSEATHVLEETIEQLSALVKRQEKASAIRDLIAQILRLLREHYNIFLEQGRNYMDG